MAFDIPTASAAEKRDKSPAVLTGLQIPADRPTLSRGQGHAGLRKARRQGSISLLHLEIVGLAKTIGPTGQALALSAQTGGFKQVQEKHTRFQRTLRPNGKHHKVCQEEEHFPEKTASEPSKKKNSVL